MPETPAKFPIRTNNGITVKGSVTEISNASVLKVLSAARYPFIAPVPKKPTTSMAMATGTRKNNKAKSAISPMKPMAVADN